MPRTASLDPTPAGATLSRRSLLRHAGLGLATIAVAGTGLVTYRAYDQGVLVPGDGPAYRPWSTWKDGGGLEPLVRAAVLAPSPHNAQPWLFSLGSDHLDVHIDRTRNTGATDPFHREMEIGIGAAVENVALAARANGWAPTVELVPSGGDHVARVHLAASTARISPLYRQIAERHTNRYPYVADRPVDPADLAAMSAVALSDVEITWITDGPRRRAFGDLLVEATEAVIADDEQSADDSRWFRQRRDDIQQQRDGITVDASGLPALTTAMAKLLPAQSQSAIGQSWLDGVRSRHTATAAAYGILTVRDASDLSQRVRGGRTLQRVHLWATGAGLGLHHMNQATERVDRERQLGLPAHFEDALAAFVPPGRQALSSFRIGHPTQAAKPSPRRAIEAVIL